MGILDNLALLASGYGKGQLAGQALKNQLAEQRRKALLEERAQRVQESEAQTLGELRHAQALQAGEEVATGRSLREHLDTPVNYSFDVAGNKIKVGTTRGLNELSGVIEGLIREQGYINRANLFGSGKGRIPKTPEEFRQSTLDDLLRTVFQFSDPNDPTFGTQVMNVYDLVDSMMKKRFPEIYNKETPPNKGNVLKPGSTKGLKIK